MSAQKRYDAIDGLRTLACMGIVSMHMLASGRYNVSGFVFDKFIPSLTNFVFIFMTISAFGMCCGYYNKVLNHQLDVVDFYKKRYAKILPFFAFLCVLDLISSPSKESFYEAFANVTLCFGLIPNANITVIGVGWFLGVVFVFYMIFPFFCFLMADKRRAWITFAMSAIMNILSTIYFNVDRKYMPYSFMFFVAGGLIYLYKEKLDNRVSKVLAIIGFLISCYMFYRVEANPFIILAISVFLLLYAVNVSNRGFLINKMTKFIGGLSFEIYLCHMFVYRVVEKLHLLKITGNDYLNYITAYILVFTGAAVFAYISNKTISKIQCIIREKVENGDNCIKKSNC